MRKEGEGGHGGEVRWNLGQNAAGQWQRGVEGPLLQVYGMERTEAITLEVLGRELQPRGAVQQRETPQREGRVDWHGGSHALTAHV